MKVILKSKASKYDMISMECSKEYSLYNHLYTLSLHLTTIQNGQFKFWYHVLRPKLSFTLKKIFILIDFSTSH